jgi:hypothetical protein
MVSTNKTAHTGPIPTFENIRPPKPSDMPTLAKMAVLFSHCCARRLQTHSTLGLLHLGTAIYKKKIADVYCRL